uniref:Abhydrolase domain containing 10, depalmitoylase n=1 Tax=Anolis carolinensis TaxID=28377 RepID=A0A803TVY5_ANOCA
MALSGAARLLWREKLRWGPAVSRLGCRQKSSPSFLNRADLPKLAYHKLKGKNPGVVFLPGLFSNMNGEKALALEEYCKSVGHAFVRFDYRGCGGSDGNTKENTLGKWRKDVLSILDELTQGPQVKKEIEEKGEWRMPTKHNEEGFYSVPYELIQEAENHCVLNSPLPIKCPVRLIHGLKDDDVPWQISMKIAECVVSGDVDIILRKGGGHRMKEKEDIKLIVYTVEDLIEQLST